MNDSENKEKSPLTNEGKSSIEQSEGENSENEKITPFRCFSGSAISGALGFATYLLSKSIVMTYSTMPIKFNNAFFCSIMCSDIV